jgi:hypothetical protein
MTASRSARESVIWDSNPSAGRSVPDARISASFAYWFEVKTERNALRLQQLAEHLANLDGQGGDERLFVITPDASRPSGPFSSGAGKLPGNAEPASPDDTVAVRSGLRGVRLGVRRGSAPVMVDGLRLSVP